MAEDVKLSILIATSGRPGYLQKLLDSIFTDELPQATQIIILVNGGCGKADEVLDSMSKRYGSLEVIRTDIALSFGAARNMLISKAKGEILHFIDDDVVIKGDLFKKILKKFELDPKLDVIGGPNLTPNGSTGIQKLIGHFFESRFGAYEMRYRYKGIGKDCIACERKLILCNLAFHNRVFKDNGFSFNGKVPSNEENILLGQIADTKCRIVYSPELALYHHRRGSLIGFAKQMFKYGRGRFANIVEIPKTFNPIFLAPLALFVNIFIFILYPTVLFSIPLAAYVMIDIISSIHIALRQRNPSALLVLPLIFPLGHLSYSMGFIYQSIKNVTRG